MQEKRDPGAGGSRHGSASGPPRGEAGGSKSLPGEPLHSDTTDIVPKEKKKKKKKKGDKGSLGSPRGIETMFRSSYRAHLDLTSLADSKANIMISINGLILSIILGAIAPKIDTNIWLVLPTTAILITCVVAIVYAVLAARPRYSPHKSVTLQQAKEGDINLLFFGNASQLSEDEFVEGLTAMVRDTNQLYRNMMRDLYGMASVLGRKFSLLRASYTVFMIGITFSVLAFILVFVLEAGSAGQ